MGNYDRLRNSGVVIGIILLHLFVFSFCICADELSFVVGETGQLQVTPGLEVTGSPGAKPGRAVLCERIRIHGLRRLKHLDKYAHSLKLLVAQNVSTGAKASNIEVCFHRNLSRAVGMCPQSRWEKVSKGSWVQTMSPFDHKILDVRIASSSKVTLDVSAVEEFFLYRIVFLILGTLMLCLASTLSKSLAFYYSSAMAVGIFLVVLLVLFQGMKLLPTGRSSFALFIYSSVLGLGGFLLRYIPGLFENLLVEMGIDEEMYTPLAIFIGSFLSLGGAFFGFWTVRKLVLTEDGSVDISTSLFVCWSIRILAVLFILQSSVDPLLAAGALISVMVISSILKKITKLKFLLRVYEIPLNLLRAIWETIRYAEMPSVPGYLHDFMQKKPDSTQFRNHGINRMQGFPVSESDSFPSTFHKTPERTNLTKEEWKKFTKDSTTKAVKELVSSPGFSKWAAANADRISVSPRNDSGRSADRPRKWLGLF